MSEKDQATITLIVVTLFATFIAAIAPPPTEPLCWDIETSITHEGTTDE